MTGPETTIVIWLGALTIAFIGAYIVLRDHYDAEVRFAKRRLNRLEEDMHSVKYEEHEHRITYGLFNSCEANAIEVIQLILNHLGLRINLRENATRHELVPREKPKRKKK